MKTFRDHETQREILTRLDRVTPESPRRWGRMTAHQMICHLSDSFRGVLGDFPVSPGPGPLPGPILKFVALRMPIKWPHNVQTRPEVDQQVGGTRPAVFAADVATLKSAFQRFVSNPRAIGSSHPIFGPMSEFDWMRWGYLHMDHHLRQFGK